MKIDVHAHIFPPEVIAEREKFFHREPAFEALYRSAKSRLVDAETLVEAMDEGGIDVTVVFGFPWRQEHLARRHNDYVLEAAARFPGRILPMVCFDPTCPYALPEARRGLEAGAVGLGELAVYEACAEEEVLHRYEELAALCREKTAVLLVHANEPVGHIYPGKAPMGLKFYYELARRTRGVPLILAHWGGGLFFFERLKRETRDVLSHVFYDTAASPFLYHPEIYREAVRTAGANRVLLGTDYPLLSVARYEREMADAGLDERERAAILGDNAARLFGLPVE
ncbi:hypothetical protein SAMN02745206_00849 [Desulfacinum infernum DSM 9756]|uniref:Amidohydrolase-related domain-containing protein n=1 Tax=Desulfacinum infernum DSM 9756 TaxID=1121391 RepID=A0A1M4WEB2_9BACT|nr:amidohydrolase family protein [Desulfacinum infernum]SHE79544.1 hypothetical protein SAMN02745206_00849 [Desulfacinum infernum DSM 9756]